MVFLHFSSVSWLCFVCCMCMCAICPPMDFFLRRCFGNRHALRRRMFLSSEDSSRPVVSLLFHFPLFFSFLSPAQTLLSHLSMHLAHCAYIFVCLSCTTFRLMELSHGPLHHDKFSKHLLFMNGRLLGWRNSSQMVWESFMLFLVSLIRASIWNANLH